MNLGRMTTDLHFKCVEMRTGLKGQFESDARFTYRVVELATSSKRKTWKFMVEGVRGKTIHVLPLEAPLKRFDDLVGQNLVFRPSSRLHCFYHEILMAQRNGQPDRRLRQSDRALLPRKIRRVFRRSVKPRSQALANASVNADSLVFLVDCDEHTRMIELYFATKIWPLLEQANG